MNHIYLAGPMSGLPLYNFEEFNRVTKILRDAGYSVFSPAEKDLSDGFNPATDPQKPFLHYMKIDLPEVMKSDFVVLLKGWEKSKGANLEVVVAKNCGIPVCEFVENDDRTSWDTIYLNPPSAEATIKTEPEQKPKQEIRQYSTGAIRDSEEGKEDYTETISWTAFKRYAEYMTSKKKQYGSGNFKKGISIDSYERSLMRHISKYMINKYEGGDLEKDSDHLAAIVFNIFGIMHEEARNLPITVENS